MRLTILGGGGFRVPLVFRALLHDPRQPIGEVVLYDVQPSRLGAISSVLQQMSHGHDAPPTVRSTTHLDEALEGASFVFCAIRVGGLEARMHDEQVPRELGLLGQETTGAGGVAYALRTVPVVLRIAQHIAQQCPSAWVVNFTNPAGIVTEAMQQVLGDRVIGICDSPAGLVARATRALRLEADLVSPDYVGLNHLGWLRGLSHRGREVLPELLADDRALRKIEEVHLFGVDWVRDLEALPNEYLYYYYFTREALTAQQSSPRSRGELLLRQQDDFYRHAAQRPDDALHAWEQVRRARSASYLAENRAVAGAPDRSSADVDSEGYEGVAARVVAALSRNDPTALILNVRNGSGVAGLPPTAVVEVPCIVDANGPRHAAITAPSMHMTGLMQQVKAVEQLTIEAAVEGSRHKAVAAFALHPLVDSVAVARDLVDGYCRRIPTVADVLDRG